MTNEELEQIRSGALRYHTMSSEVVLRLVAEVKWLRLLLEARKTPDTFNAVLLQRKNATD